MHGRVALGAQSLFAQAVWSGTRIMIGYRAIHENAEPWLLVLLTAVFAAPALLAAIPAGHATDRFGGSGIAAAGSVVCAIGIAFVLVLPGLGWLIAGSAIIGLGNLLLMVGQQSFVAHVAQDGPTEGAFGFLSATASAGQAVGPLVVTVVAGLVATSADDSPTSLGLAVCLALSLLCIPALRSMRTAEKVWSNRVRLRSESRSTIRSVPLAKVWPALAVSGIVVVTLDLLYTFVPVWGEEHGISPAAVGFLLSLRAVVSMISRLGLLSLVRRIGFRGLLGTSTIVSMAALALFPHSGFPEALVLTIFLGIGLGIPQPLTMSWSVSLAAPDLHGAVLGMRLSTNRLGQIVIPLAVGLLAAPLGAAAVFYANAALLAGASSIAWWRAAPKQ